MRKLEIKSYGVALPEQVLYFGDQRRFRVSGNETQLSLAIAACRQALSKGNYVIDDIDCIVSASAVGIQPIPSTAALIHEQLALGTDIPAMDINTTCTSFISALDLMSYLLEAGRYHRILIVSSEVGSRGLNPQQKESYELFSDGACAFIFESTKEAIGVQVSVQKTWSEGAHDTEIRGGLTGLLPHFYTEDRASDYQFDMKGRKILSLTAKKLPKMIDQFFENQQISKESIDYIIPHQASKALPLIMKKLGFDSDSYLNIVSEYGNMVSVSVPFSLAYALDHGKVKKGDRIILMGTAAGLTTNMLVMMI